MEYNIYCDESCHLENDHNNIMVLGAVWGSIEFKKDICKKIKEIKKKHNISSFFEMKWTKISPSKIDFYLDVVNYFFDEDNLNFRGLVIINKNKLSHDKYAQNHNDWYYKMYFNLLKIILSPHDSHNIYLDIKDTCGGEKVRKLKEVLSNNMFDFSRNIIKKIQLVHSHEIEILQLTDLFIGALSYLHRELKTSSAKLEIIKKIQEKSNYDLQKSTLFKEKKFNLFCWDTNYRKDC
jgi:hypothetical protein